MPFQAQPTEKCTACAKTVYQTERAVVEEKTDKKIYHKQCIRCSTCNKVLTTGQYSSMDGQFWCKPHFKQLFATKGNYDEAFGKEKVTSKWDSSATPVSPPTSFIPADSSASADKEKKVTSEATAAKFKQFREQADSDKCTSCGKTVYLAEKLLVEDKNEKRLFHKRCFACADCNLTLDLRSYGSFGGKIYCKNHLKEQQSSANANTKSNVVSSGPVSFIPMNEEKKQEKGTTPDSIASKFKGAETEKCKSCGKSVYATEKVILPESFKQQSIYHKTCLKCSVCSCKLDIHNYGSANGTLFCQTHLKQYGKPEQAKGDYFVSPLANTNPDYVAGPKDGADGSYTSDRDQDRSEREDDRKQDSEREDRRQESDREEQRRQESDREEQRQQSDREEQAKESDREDARQESSRNERSSSISSTGGRGSPALERNSDSERVSSPALERKVEQISLEDNARNRSSSRSGGDDEDDSKKREAERARKREERQRQIEEEERREEEERQRRKKERERRLAEASEDSSSTSLSSSGGNESREAERERRKKEREDERKREEEDRERQEEKRRQEREERRKAQEEDTKRELAEQEKKAEERRRKLAELKGDA